MASNYVYPTAAEFFEIGQDLINEGKAGRQGLMIAPTVTKNTFNVRWGQQDNYHGLQQMRGLDGQPPRVQRIGSATYTYEPGVYGEFTQITETELLKRAIPGHPEIRIPVDDLVMADARLLTARELDGMEAKIWQLLATGTLSVPLGGPNAPLSWSDTYTIQTYSPVVPWSTLSTATPITNMQTIQQLSVGHSSIFGPDATMYMNQVTANRLINNSNSADFGGKRDMYGATLNNLPALNSYFQKQNLPKVEINDRGYQLLPLSGPITAPTTQFKKFIPDGTAILVGKRPDNSNVLEFQQTINAMNPGFAAGPYQFIKDFSAGINAPKEVPPRLEVHRGMNGGLAILFPSAIVAISGL